MDMKEKLVELLNNSFAEQYEKRGLLTAPHTATDLIAHGVTVQEWISVKDRLPENKSCILMYSADGGVAEGIYDKDQKRWIQFRWGVLNVPSVTHWMPLPQPPKGE